MSFEHLSLSQLHAKRDVRIREYLLTAFQDHGVPVTVIIAGRYVQLIPESKAHRTSFPNHDVISPTTFEVLLFVHLLSGLNGKVKHRALNVIQLYVKGSLIGC